MRNIREPYIRADHAWRNYVESQFHRVVHERDTLRICAWIWFIAALAGWVTAITVAFEADIIHL